MLGHIFDLDLCQGQNNHLLKLLLLFFPTKILALGSDLPNIKWPCRNLPWNSIAFTGDIKIKKTKISLYIIELSIHHL